MNGRARAVLVGLLVLSAGCYKATVETGLPAGTDTINKPWAASWIGGLIPPATVNAASTCRSGVARVETQHSFLNMLVGGLTFGIFTPMTIKVTCASSRGDVPATRDLAIRDGSADATWQAVFARAAEIAAERGSATVEILKQQDE